MTDDEYNEKRHQDLAIINHMSFTERSAFVRAVNDLMLQFKSRYRLPASDTPIISYAGNKFTGQLSVHTLEEANAYSKRRRCTEEVKRCASINAANGLAMQLVSKLIDSNGLTVNNAAVILEFLAKAYGCTITRKQGPSFVLSGSDKVINQLMTFINSRCPAILK